ncbi:MAG: hypothetical protein R6U96_08730, partial [Promethearchaeia archaeon]
QDINKQLEEARKERQDFNRRFEEARKERKDIKESMIILRETLCEYMKKTINLKQDIKEGNNEIMDYLKNQLE